MKRKLVALLGTSLALAACSGGSDDGQATEADYFETIRTLESFKDMSDVELRSIAESTCGLIEKVVVTGMNNEEAMDRAFQTFQKAGLAEEEALLVTISAVGSTCPMDITE